ERGAVQQPARGVPRAGPARRPVPRHRRRRHPGALRGDRDQAEIRLPDFALSAAPVELEAGSGERWIAFATVGVPHLVIEVDDIEAVDVPGRGRALQYDPRVGTAGANVNFLAAPARPGLPWLIRTYERGVEGETLACGTGTVAAGIALASRGEVELPVRFRSRGGEA